MTNLWNIVDKFRPENRDSSEIFKSRMFVLASWFIILFSLLLIAVEFFIGMKIRTELFIYLFCQGGFFLYLHKKFNIIGIFILITCLSFLIYSVNIIILGGAYLNTLVFWFCIIPLLVTFIGGRGYGAIATVSVLISIYVLYERLHENGLVLRNGLNFEQYVALQNLNLTATSIFVFVFSLIIIGTQSALEKKMSRVQSKMEENSRSFLINRMSAGLSHEINNPLCAIRFANEVVKMCAQKETIDREKIVKMSKKIDDSIDRAVIVVDTLKKIGSDVEEKNFKYVQIEEILHDIETVYQTDTIKHKLKIEFVNETLPSDKIFCSKEKLIEALIHVIDNAVYVTKKLPESDRLIRIQVKEKKPYYSFLISDSGKGIELETAKHMFDPFFTAKDVNEGMGLGLTLAQAITKNHSGKVNYSLINGRTTFEVSFGII